MKMIISEKAIAGRRIASILAGKEVPATASGKAIIFSFKRAEQDWVVVPLRGHIVDVDFPKKYSYWLGTDLKKLATAEIEYLTKEKVIASALKSLGEKADEVIIATDADREGESIGVEALNIVKQSKPKIAVKRAYFSAITQKDIEDAFAKLAKVDFNFADSADSRREIDLLWGAVLTRFLSLVSGQLGKDFLSAGRVQTPVLAILVKREKERNAFKSKKYWVVSALFEKDSKNFETEHKNGQMWDKETAEKIMEKKSERGIVKSISRKKRVLARPTPFNTTNFLRAATAIGMSAGEAMNHAEFLYQQGYTSYPRTDNTHYPPTIDLKQILDEMVKVNEFSHLVGEILSRGKLVPSAGEKASKDHPPIHPVSAAPKSKLSERQWKIYELIVRRFLATLSEDAETENQSVEIHVNGEPFIARGQLILKAGWKDVYPYSKITEVILPEMLEGDEVKLLKMNLLEKETVPPPRYSQSSLIKLMEDLNLGTKATRHEILQKLYARHYIAGLKAMEPNQVAFAVIDSLDKYAKRVTEPKMTAELEKEMDLVAAGKKSKKEVVDESRDFLGIILEDMLKNKNNVGSDLRKALQADSVIGTCDKCGKGQLRKLKSKNGKWFLACNRYPDCMNTYPLPQKGKIVSTDKLCEQCGKPVIKVFGKRYRYEMCIFPQCPSKADWKKAGEKKLENTVKKKDSEAISTAVIQKPKQ